MILAMHRQQYCQRATDATQPPSEVPSDTDLESAPLIQREKLFRPADTGAAAAMIDSAIESHGG
ncbi:hypothetical protein MPLB_1490059 [Mesorhizobium sp. ORS 3324]|nr:hypothetical protein MPLB_1490059 [Mesorhizobium sp. ORS 3324]